MFVLQRGPRHQPLYQLHTVMMTFDCINLKSTPRLTILQFQCRHAAWLDLTFLSLARPQCRPGLTGQVGYTVFLLSLRLSDDLVQKMLKLNEPNLQVVAILSVNGCSLL